MYHEDGHKNNISGDRIVYTIHTKGGGEDGRDMKNHPPRMVLATLNPTDAKARVNDANGTLDLQKVIVDFDVARPEAMKKLNAIDRLVLGLPQEPIPQPNPQPRRPRPSIT